MDTLLLFQMVRYEDLKFLKFTTVLPRILNHHAYFIQQMWLVICDKSQNVSHNHTKTIQRVNFTRHFLRNLMHTVRSSYTPWKKKIWLYFPIDTRHNGIVYHFIADYLTDFHPSIDIKSLSFSYTATSSSPSNSRGSFDRFM